MNARAPRDYALAFNRNLTAAEPGGSASDAPVDALNADPNLATRFGCSLLHARMAPISALREAAATVARANIPVLVVTGGWSPFLDAVGITAAPPS